MLTVALPKGRIADETLAIFEKIFGGSFKFDNRKLILDREGFRFLLVRNQDVPTYVAHQAADLGVVGLDVLEGGDFDLMQLLDLGIGRCRVVVGVPANRPLDPTAAEIKVATKMDRIARKFFSSRAMAVEVVKLYGSIELAPLVGLADAIVDIVETGTTMRENGLVIHETIMESTARLIANPNSFIAKKEEIRDITDRIASIIAAR
ncbi:MAG: ATP phosphoribosyltransferase [Campylobacterales bacterium]